MVVLVLVLGSRHLPAKDSSLKLSALGPFVVPERLSSIVSGISDGNPPDYDYIPRRQLRVAIGDMRGVQHGSVLPLYISRVRGPPNVHGRLHEVC